MKKYFIFCILCGLLTASAAFAANLSPYQYNPKQPPVEIDLGVLDDIEAQQQAAQNPPPAASAESAEVSQPALLTPPAPALQQEEQQPAEEEAEALSESAPVDYTEKFLDKIMSNHLPPGTKKKTVKIRTVVTPPAPPRKPLVPVSEAPAEAKPVVEPAPAVVETPQAEEKPAEAQATPEIPAEAKPVEDKPTMPVVRERRRRTPQAAAPEPADMTIAFDKTSSALSPTAEINLDALIMQVRDTPDLRIQIRAYASGEDGNASNARRMSLSRALMVRSYLIEKGISAARLDVRALGAEGDAPPSDQVELVFQK